MPSPFPGMDPYLEAPSVWSGVHPLLIARTVRALNGVLPSTYFAKPNERIYVVDDERTIFPDTAVIHDPISTAAARGPVAQDAVDPPLVLVAEPAEVVEGFVEIVRADGSGRVVACLEVLSPRNKSAGHEGRELYLTQQRELVGSRTHLVEVDLLRAGPHTVAAPEVWIGRHGPWHYVVSLHRGGDGERYEAWTATVRERLPRFHVPLDSDDEPVIVDLQELVADCYEDGVFSRQIDYSRAPPAPAFARADREWLDEVLRPLRSTT